MSKKKEAELKKFKESITEKLKELGFENLNNSSYWQFELPLGNETVLMFDFDEYVISIAIPFVKLINIRKIESPDDLENLFNAICPEKYRLPFG